MKRADLPPRLSIEYFCPFPAWACSVHYPDGRVLKRFKSESAMMAWLTRNGYGTPTFQVER